MEKRTIYFNFLETTTSFIKSFSRLTGLTLKLKPILRKKILNSNFANLLIRSFKVFGNVKKFSLIVTTLLKQILKEKDLLSCLNLSDLIAKMDFLFPNQNTLLFHEGENYLNRKLMDFFLVYLQVLEGEIFNVPILSANQYNNLGITPITKRILNQNIGLSFLMKNIDNRSSLIRIKTWNLLVLTLDLKSICQNMSIIDICIENIIKLKETKGVIAISIYFLCKILEILLLNEKNEKIIGDEEEEIIQKEEDTNEKLSKEELLNILSKKSKYLTIYNCQPFIV